MAEAGRQNADGKLIALTIPSADCLRHYYLPFFDSGAVFIPTGRTVNLGDQLLLIISLDAEDFATIGRVVWFAPSNGVSDRKPGIAVQFGDAAESLNKACQSLLANTDGEGSDARRRDGGSVESFFETAGPAL